jgi:hypothetical protein
MTAALPVSPYLWGTNLVTMDELDFFLTDTATIEHIPNMHIGMIRFPNRHNPRLYTAAAHRIRQLGVLPLAILPYNNLEADLMMVDILNTLFGSALIYYEFGNERDGTWFGPYQSPADYAAAWNRSIPLLKTRARNARFVGPVNYHADPAYIAAFLQQVSVLPDAVSWHEYTCPSDASSELCIERIDRWSTHIAETRQAMRDTIRQELPVIISEWNWNPLNTPDPRMQDYDFIYRWTRRAFAVLVENQVFASCQYCLTNYAGLAMLDDRTHTLTGQAAAFRDSFELYCRPPLSNQEQR